MFRVVLSLLIISGLFSSCYWIRHSKGGGQVEGIPSRKINADDIAIMPGFKIEAVASGFTFPTAIAFDDTNSMYVVEAGYSYGEVWTVPRLLRIDAAGKTTEVAKGERNGPWTGITWHNGAFYLAEGGEANGGRILRITKEGQITAIVSNLPTMGDHHTNGPIVKDGYIYFGLGTATNSGVVGEDNARYGWLKRKRGFHDIPCKDLRLAGQNYTTGNALTDDATDRATTGAYVPFGTTTTSGQVVKGALPCSGSILRVPLNGGNIELVGWGLRNPFGLAQSPDGKIFITENAYDDRGSRPVWGAGDVLWEIKDGLWYGWPDFAAGKSIIEDEEFKVPGKERVKPLLQSYPNTPPKPSAVFGVHASATGIDFSRNNSFGFEGDAFVTEFGDMAPEVGKVLSPVGYKVVRVDVNTGIIRDFAVNKGAKNGPASWLRKGGLERPVSLKFNPSGTELYVVDFGIMRVTNDGAEPQMNTGVIWRITKQ